MLQSQLARPPHLSPTLPPAAISCSRGGGQRRRRRRPKPKPVAFPPPPLRRLVSSSLRRLLPRPRPLTLLLGDCRGNGWFGRGRIRAEEVAALALSLAFGDGLAGLADSWNASCLGQMLGVWAAMWKKGRRRGGFRRLASFLLGVAFCALVCRLRGVAFLEGLEKMGGGRKLVRILLH